MGKLSGTGEVFGVGLDSIKVMRSKLYGTVQDAIFFQSVNFIGIIQNAFRSIGQFANVVLNASNKRFF